jgi:hypothetical protein
MKMRLLENDAAPVDTDFLHLPVRYVVSTGTGICYYRYGRYRIQKVIYRYRFSMAGSDPESA